MGRDRTKGGTFLSDRGTPSEETGSEEFKLTQAELLGMSGGWGSGPSHTRSAKPPGGPGSG